jgi:hypothetical protein
MEKDLTLLTKDFGLLISTSDLLTKDFRTQKLSSVAVQ